MGLERPNTALSSTARKEGTNQRPVVCNIVSAIHRLAERRIVACESRNELSETAAAHEPRNLPATKIPVPPTTITSRGTPAKRISVAYATATQMCEWSKYFRANDTYGRLPPRFLYSRYQHYFNMTICPGLPIGAAILENNALLDQKRAFGGRSF